MLDKEVAIFSIVVLFIMIGIYVYFFQIPQETSGLKPVICSSNPGQSIIMLPTPIKSGISIETAIGFQNPETEFAQTTISLSELSGVLFAAQGIINTQTSERAAPSPSGMHPIRIYVVPNRVEGASCGIYLYEPQGHKLVLVKEGKFITDIRKAAFGFAHVEGSSATLILTSVDGPVKNKFGQEGGDRLVNIEAGHISQNIILASWSLGLGAVSIGTFSSEFVDTTLGIDGQNERAVYLTIIGKPDR